MQQIEWQSSLLRHLAFTKELEMPTIRLDWDGIVNGVLIHALLVGAVSKLEWAVPEWYTNKDLTKAIKSKGFVSCRIMLHGNVRGPLYLCINKASLHNLLAYRFNTPELKQIISLDRDLLDNMIAFLVASALVHVNNLGLAVSGFVDEILPSIPKEDTPVLLQSFSATTEGIGSILMHAYVPQLTVDSWNSFMGSSGNSLQMLFHNSLSSEVGVDIAFEVGRTLVPLKALLSMEKGDCILIEWGRYYNRRGIVDVSVNQKPIFSGTVSEDGLTVVIDDISAFIDFDEGEDMGDLLKKSDAYGMNEDIEDPNMESSGHEDSVTEYEHDNDDSDIVQSQALGLIDTAEVCIVFELGKKKVKIKELLSIQSGHILELPKGENVLIRVQGQYIGAGKIVRIGENLGVQIIDVKVKI